MMLLIGMWINFTKNPMKPMMQKPIAVAIAIFWYSKIIYYKNVLLLNCSQYIYLFDQV